MIDRMQITEEIVKINYRLIELERYLKYAKEADTIVSLCEDIMELRLKKDIFSPSLVSI